ncbi:ABC transporter permease [Candidatus Micrarchaeota archaeon]|nr:ABC transporter permease [Candidatus Micrarchaeota archaeon]
MKFLSVLKKEFLEIINDRTLLLVLVVFPILVMLFMGGSFGSINIRGIPIGVVGSTNTTYASALFSELNKSNAFNLQTFNDVDAAINAFRNGQLRAVIVVPDDFDRQIRNGNGSKIRVLLDNSDLALEKSLVTATSSVIQASSANITKNYVYNAWGDLKSLNNSASNLAEGITKTKWQLENTRAGLGNITDQSNDLDISSLEQSLNDATANIGYLQNLLDEQKTSLTSSSKANSELLNRSNVFLANATAALDKSKSTVQTTHDKLLSQLSDLNNTNQQLDSSITALTALKNNANDSTTKAALEANIVALKSLKDSTSNQVLRTKQEISDLESLNLTLNSFGEELANYSLQIKDASSGSNGINSTISSLEKGSAQLAKLNSSFSKSSEQVAKLKVLLADLKSTTANINSTLGTVLEQTGSFENLIDKLQKTVAEQTNKDPAVLAAPLAVEVEDQYIRTSFVDFIMPQIIAVSLLFSCLLLGSITLVREKMKKTIVQILLMPGALENLLIGKIITLMLLSFGQVLIILLVASLLFGVKPPLNLEILLFGTTISSLVLSSIGVLIGFYARSESAAVQSGLLIAIPMLFLGNIIFSPDLLPQYTQILQQLLPLAHVTNIFKIILITNGNPMIDVAALLSYFVLLVALMGYIVIKRRDITNYV